jgi:hypothetical protein
MSDYSRRIASLADRAQRDREGFNPPDSPPARQEALRYLCDGVGPAVALYIEARTGEEWVDFDPVEFALLERAMNDWLSLYARCHGVPLDADFTVREAAELLLQTHDLQDTAVMLTHVPEDERGRRPTHVG